jgi:hypothetical protein
MNSEHCCLTNFWDFTYIIGCEAKNYRTDPADPDPEQYPGTTNYYLAHFPTYLRTTRQETRRDLIKSPHFSAKNQDRKKYI